MSVAEEEEPEVQKPASPEPAAQKPEIQKPEAAIRTQRHLRTNCRNSERGKQEQSGGRRFRDEGFYKYFYPCLRNDEKLLALRNISLKFYLPGIEKNLSR